VSDLEALSPVNAQRKILRKRMLGAIFRALIYVSADFVVLLKWSVDREGWKLAIACVLFAMFVGYTVYFLRSCVSLRRLKAV